MVAMVMPYVLRSFGLRARNEKTHKQKKTKAHKTHSCCGKVSCLSLPPASLYQTNQTYLRSLEKHGQARSTLSVLIAHLELIRGLLKHRPLGLLITIVLNHGSDSSQRMSLCLLNTTSLPPSSRGQLSLLNRQGLAAAH